MRPCLSKSYVRRSNHKSHDAPKNSLFTDDIVENCEEIEYLSMGLWDGKVSQPWRDGSGGNYNLRVTFTYFIY